MLVVEDNELLRDVIECMLSGHGFTTVSVETAERGLAAFEDNPTVSLAILDMVLPGQSGLDLAAELERRRPGFRILYISGFSDSIAMESIARRDPKLVLIKPFGEDELIQRVSGLLSVAPRPAVGGWSYPWDRLVEASDNLVAADTQLLSYRDTAAGFGVAITHIAALRAAAVPYAFHFTGDPNLPIELLVLQNDRGAALALIQTIGLGADIAIAA
ncbi:MAG TPA: response regulator [Candidatus Sulfopaludibacter sp.]|nr:response regulator [Candidatus Sulfopaludibacter sp.]